MRLRRQTALSVVVIAAFGVPMLSATFRAGHIERSQAGATDGSQACTSAHWVGATTFSPSDVEGASVEGKTLRQQMFPHHGGKRLRLHFSNLLGTKPVTFGAVTVATQREGASIEPRSLRSVRFRGQASVTIPKGGAIVSDPVSLLVKAFVPLNVSIYVTSQVGPSAEHFLSAQTTWSTAAGAGDQTRDVSGSAFTEVTPPPGSAIAAPQGATYLSGLDVWTAKKVSTVAAFGDSITDGYQGGLDQLPLPAQIDKNSRWPDDLARRLQAAGRPLSVINAGIAGNALLQDGSSPYYGMAGLERFERDALSQPGVSTVMVLIGINDIGRDGASATALVDGYKQLIRRTHAAGKRIVLMTITPDDGTFEDSHGYGAPSTPTVVRVNRWIRRQKLSDGFVDSARAVADPNAPNRIAPKYDGSDHLHFNAAGYRAIARAIPLKLLRPTCAG